MSKEQFMIMREEELSVQPDFKFSKKESVKFGVDSVLKCLADGDVNPKRVWAYICKRKEILNAMDATFRDKIVILEKETIDGVEFSPVQGGSTLNYIEDDVFKSLSTQLDNRKELLNVAQKMDVYDDDGVLVPKVGSTPRKSSITVKF